MTAPVVAVASVHKSARLKLTARSSAFGGFLPVMAE
jgi:hypothetical protein